VKSDPALCRVRGEVGDDVAKLQSHEWPPVPWVPWARRHPAGRQTAAI